MIHTVIATLLVIVLIAWFVLTFIVVNNHDWYQQLRKIDNEHLEFDYPGQLSYSELEMRIEKWRRALRTMRILLAGIVTPALIYLTLYFAAFINAYWSIIGACIVLITGFILSWYSTYRWSPQSKHKKVNAEPA